ncbi:MAG: DUF2892 domain-containing protein [Actinobacteria bacterium]|uniref:Unannotated protein n=1 Tax=freshwater metagenome TaxID=449393 RepID=A0A6J7SIR3_9ZZZZ|nr:DUF2892 domain-containing protein [Actinomycetota bacterium]
MMKNESALDRSIRFVAGVVAFVLALFIGVWSGMGIVLMVIAVILLISAAAGFCPFYKILGIHSNRV